MNMKMTDHIYYYSDATFITGLTNWPFLQLFFEQFDNLKSMNPLLRSRCSQLLSEILLST